MSHDYFDRGGRPSIASGCFNAIGIIALLVALACAAVFFLGSRA